MAEGGWGTVAKGGWAAAAEGGWVVVAEGGCTQDDNDPEMAGT